MEVKQIITELEQEIARLKEARALLAGGSEARRRGRPKGTPNRKQKQGRKRRLTPEGRRRISEALKRRWAAQRKQKGAKAAKAA